MAFACSLGRPLLHAPIIGHSFSRCFLSWYKEGTTPEDGSAVRGNLAAVLLSALTAALLPRCWSCFCWPQERYTAQQTSLLMAQPYSFPEDYFSAFCLQQAEQAFQQAAQGFTTYPHNARLHKKTQLHRNRLCAPDGFAPSGWTGVWLQNYGLQLIDFLSSGSTKIEYLAFRHCLPSSEHLQLPYSPWGFCPTRIVLLGTSDPASPLARVQQVPALIEEIFRHIDW